MRLVHFTGLLTVLLWSSAPVAMETVSGLPVLDHVFVWVSRDAPEADVFKKLGFRSSRPVKHEGQGTSSLGIHFENAYLELIWIDDANLAEKAGATIHVNFSERAAAKGGASPFGIGLHMPSDAYPIPFPTVSYKAAWIEPGEVLHVTRTATDPAEPYVFIVPRYMANPPPQALPELYKKIPYLKWIREHPIGVHLVTKVEFVVAPKALKSPTLAILAKNNVISFNGGDQPLMQLTFDHQAKRKRVDLRPALPVILLY
jgi:hypothetical protein